MNKLETERQLIKVQLMEKRQSLNEFMNRQIKKRKIFYDLEKIGMSIEFFVKNGN